MEAVDTGGIFDALVRGSVAVCNGHLQAEVGLGDCNIWREKGGIKATPLLQE